MLASAPALLTQVVEGTTDASAAAETAPPEVAWAYGVLALLIGFVLWSTVGKLAGKVLVGSEPGRRPRAGWWAVELFAVAFAVYGVLLVAATLIMGEGSSPLAGLISMEIALAVGVGLALFLAHRTTPDGGGLAAMGVAAPKGLGRELTYGAVALLVYSPLVVGAMILAPGLLELVGRERVVQQVLLDILAMEGPALALAFVLAAVVTPLLEEALFRGFVQPACVDRVGPAAGILFTSLLFAVIHGVDAFLPLTVLALLLGYLRHRTGGLAAPVLVHGLWNGTTLLLTIRGVVPVS